MSRLPSARDVLSSLRSSTTDRECRRETDRPAAQSSDPTPSAATAPTSQVVASTHWRGHGSTWSTVLLGGVVRGCSTSCRSEWSASGPARPHGRRDAPRVPRRPLGARAPSVGRVRARGPRGRAARRASRGRARPALQQRRRPATTSSRFAPWSCSHRVVDLEPVSEVDERVAGDRPHACSRSRARCRSASARETSRRRRPVGRPRYTDAPRRSRPRGATRRRGPVAGLLGGDAVRLHEVLGAVGSRRVHRHGEPLDEAPGSRARATGTSARSPSRARPPASRARSAGASDRTAAAARRRRSRRRRRSDPTARWTANPGALPSSATALAPTRARHDRSAPSRSLRRSRTGAG